MRRLAWTLVLFVLAACGGKGAGTGAASSTPSSSKSPTLATASPTARTGATTADITGRLKAAGLPMANIVIYTAETDTNHLLGRPGQYTGKANWNDTRDPDTTDTYSVELFATTDDLSRREQYVKAINPGMEALRSSTSSCPVGSGVG